MNFFLLYMFFHIDFLVGLECSVSLPPWATGPELLNHITDENRLGQIGATGEAMSPNAKGWSISRPSQLLYHENGMHHVMSACEGGHLPPLTR